MVFHFNTSNEDPICNKYAIVFEGELFASPNSRNLSIDVMAKQIEICRRDDIRFLVLYHWISLKKPTWAVLTPSIEFLNPFTEIKNYVQSRFLTYDYQTKVMIVDMINTGNEENIEETGETGVGYVVYIRYI
jgi:hypothetical protein